MTRPRDGEGLRTPVDGATRWQGSTPGEFALLKTQGYQWFGADGSMVGCTEASACVGFAADGTIAITPGPDQPAAVYDARGTYVGDFDSDGRSTTPAANPPTLAVALAKSGVDVTSLVDTGTRRLPFAGGATGDPHLVTAGGVRFTTQLTGQYVARGGDPEHAIQLEFDPMAHRRDVTLVSAVAIGAGIDVIQVDMAGTVTIDRERRTPDEQFDQVTLDSGVAVGIWPRDDNRVTSLAVVWPDGSSVVMAANPALGVSIVAHLPRDPAAVGLFGAGSATTPSDLVGRSGISQDVAGTVTSWQVTRPELLFDTLVAPLADFPETSATVEPEAVQEADTACRAAGILQMEDRTACVFDVGLTGDPGFVRGHQMLAVPASAQLPASAAWALWPALRPAATPASAVGSDGLIDVNLGAGQQVAYRVSVPADGALVLVNQRGCPANSGPGMGVAAARVFDPAGHAVSARLPLCGHQTVTDLEPGTYSLVLAGPTVGSSTHARMQVTPGA